jgi:23S rRNA (pseudouridine1915-N3)-methyltransferase
MKCKIISISHKLSDWEKEAFQFYTKQIPLNFKISFAEVKPLSSKNLDTESILEAEREEIVKQVDADSYVILWDRAGQKINSRGFATLLQDKIDHGININFIIGGAHGVSKKLFTTSQLILSASELTFPHRLFKIFLMEQIYRASTIHRNHPYHK